MDIEIKKPVYLLGAYYKVPQRTTWNESLIQGIRDLIEELSTEKTDVFEIDIRRNDDLNEYEEAGSAGYSVLANKKTDYYYIDFLATDKNDPPKGEDEMFIELNKALTKHIAETKEAGFHGSQYEYQYSWDDEGHDISRLRAFFIGEPE